MPTIEEYSTDPYKALGLRPIINATCHHTRVGGTLIRDEVLDAMRAAAAHHVDMNRLQKAAGEIIARHTHAEAGLVVSGCAAAILAGTAAVLTGKDPVKMQELPHLDDMKNEVIAERFPRRTTDNGAEYIHYGYAHAVKTTGIQFVEVGDGSVTTPEELDAVFTPDTAMVYWGTGETGGNLRVEEVVEIADRHDVPVLVDNSNSLPPKRHLWRYIDAGAALVTFSGGKGIRGPQGSGILAGRADLIEAAAMQSAPTQGIARVAKVSKEEVVGLVTALEMYAAEDEETLLTDQRARADILFGRLDGIANASVELLDPDHRGRLYPTVWLTVGPETGMTAAQVLEKLENGDPSIAAMSHSDPQIVRLDVRLCEEWEIDAVATRLHEILG
ncbi:MAG: aminotransferase class V-fold PLP-dependent enzyme [Chloroflexi bacterium]|nr:aminotransferase class V-fold PLP-dependent enzyme [Chloroflexota bacterium]